MKYYKIYIEILWIIHLNIINYVLKYHKLCIEIWIILLLVRFNIKDVNENILANKEK